MGHLKDMSSNGLVCRMLLHVIYDQHLTASPVRTHLNTFYFSLAVAVLLAVIIILITGALAVGVFLNYKRTGSFIPSMPKLPRYLGSSRHINDNYAEA